MEFMRGLWKVGLALAVVTQFLSVEASAADEGALKAGAARVEITPDANAIPRPFTSILDSLYARAIYLENGHDRTVLLNADVGGVPTAITDRVAADISRELNVPAANILISATHDHSAIFGGPRPGPGAPAAGNPAANAFETKLVSGLEQAAKQAHDKMQPAKVGYGEGKLYLNVNRDAINEKTRLWSQEPNLAYPSDKILAVIKIESLSGQLIAVYLNYAMHANSLFLNGMVSGDFPGEAQRYLERTYDKAIAVWTSGAAGDQNPLYWRADHVVEQARVRAIMEAEHVDLGTAIMHAMFIGNPAADKVPLDPVAMEQSIQLVKAMGLLTGEETIRVMDQIRVMNTQVKIEGAQQEVTCPARHRLDTGREGAPGKYEDSPDPVHIKIGALRIGDVVLGSANAELYNMIGQQVKAGSKFHHTIMVTLTNGMANSGYVPTDDAFGRYTFQVLGSSLKPGCAESGIVNGIDDMIGKME
jgi:neutral ceramidase